MAAPAAPPPPPAAAAREAAAAKASLLSSWSCSFACNRSPFYPWPVFCSKAPAPPTFAASPSPQSILETVKETGRALLSLEEAGLVTLDYNIPLQGGSNALYAQSPLYQEFTQVAAQGSALPGAVFDQPALEMGSMAVTPRGLALADHLQNL